MSKEKEAWFLRRVHQVRSVGRQLRAHGLTGLLDLLVRAPRIQSATAMGQQQNDWLQQRDDAHSAASAQLTEAERKAQADAVFTHRLSILIPTYNTDPAMLEALVQSLLNQTCPAWEACFYDGCSTKAETIAALKALPDRDARLRVTFGQENGGISVNTNRALAMAEGDWVALLDHDDLLTEDAVFSVLQAASAGADFVYSNEDKCDEAGQRLFDRRAKPDFSPHTLRSTNYICHLMAMKTELMREVGGLRPAFDGSQDHDLALRATEKAKHVVHVPKVLYHWRMVTSSTSHSRARACARAATLAGNEALQRAGFPARLKVFGYHNLLLLKPMRRRITLIRTAEAPLSPLCRLQLRLLGVRRITTACTAVAINEAARAANTDLLLIAHPRIRLRGRSLRLLAAYALQPEVACAAPVLMADACRTANAGYAIGADGIPFARLAGVMVDASPSLFAEKIDHDVSAVSAALLMIRRDVLLRLGGLEESLSPEAAAVALGLRAGNEGLYNVSIWRAAIRLPQGLVPSLTDTDREAFRRVCPDAVERFAGWTMEEA